MPSVDTISSATSPSRGTAAQTGATSVFASSGEAGGLFATLIGAVGGNITDLFGLQTATTTPTTSTDTGSSTSTNTNRKTRTAESDATGDPTAALAALLGAVQMPSISPSLGSTASLGAAADGRSRASDPTSGLGAPTSEVGAVAPTPPVSSTASTAATATAATAVTAAAALGAALAGETDAATARSGTVVDTTTPSTAAADATTSGTTAPPLPPALAAAVAAAKPGVETPDALRRLTGRAVPATDEPPTTPATSTSPTSATETTATGTEVLSGSEDRTTSTLSTASTDDEPTVETASGEGRRVRALPERRDAGDTAPLAASARPPHAAPRDPATPVALPATDTAATGRDSTTSTTERGGAEPTTAAALPDATLDPTTSPFFTDLGASRTSAVATAREVGPSATSAVALAELPEAIATRSRDGHSRFDIRLSPAELGNVDVRVEVRSSGEVRAHLVVERTETLDMMLRDQRQLERSLSDAGLDVGSSGLQFSLKEQPGGHPGQGWRTYGEAAARSERTTSDDDTTAEAAVAAIGSAVRRPARVGGIDLSV